MRSVAAVVATVLGVLLASMMPASAAVGPTLPDSKAADACSLLSSDEITAQFADAPLDPGPTKAKLPKRAQKQGSQCLWDDEKTDGPVPQLIVHTALARNLKKWQKQLLTTPQADTARAMTDAELEGLGSKGVIDINADGSYASVGALKGDAFYIVSVGYVGATPPAPIGDAAILGLARVAAKRV